MHWHIASRYYNFLDSKQTVEYIYAEKRRTHAVGLSLSRKHKCYVKATLTNKPQNPRCTIATFTGTGYMVEHLCRNSQLSTYPRRVISLTRTRPLIAQALNWRTG